MYIDFFVFCTQHELIQFSFDIIYFSELCIIASHNSFVMKLLLLARMDFCFNGGLNNIHSHLNEGIIRCTVKISLKEHIFLEK